MRPFILKFKASAFESYLPFLCRVFASTQTPGHYALTQVLVEAYNNARKHGAKGKGGWIEIEIESSSQKTTIRVSDGGKGFRRKNRPAKQWGTSGRGLFLIESLADSIRYKKERKRFCLEAIKYHV